MMRRAKKLTRKPDPLVESPDDSGENRTQPKKLKTKKTANMPKPVENEGTKDVATVVAKKGRANVKEKPSKPEEMNEESQGPKKMTKKAKGKKPVKSDKPVEGAAGESSDTEEVTTAVAKKGRANVKEKASKPEEINVESQEPKKMTKKAKGKKPVKSDEPVEGAAGESSDKESTEKPKQTPKKLNALRKKSAKSVKSDEHDEEASEESSDQRSTEKPKQTPKKVSALRKKSVKSVKSDEHDEEASEESSDQRSTEKPKQTPKKVSALRKKPVKSVKSDEHDEEASEESSDQRSTEKPKQTPKKVSALLKKPVKSVKSDEHDEEAAEESSDQRSTEKPKQTPKKVSALRKKPVKSVKSDEHDEEASEERSTYTVPLLGKDQRSTEKPKQTPKKVSALRKKPVKSVKSDEHDEEASEESSDKESTEKPKQTPKKLKALRKKSAKSIKSEEHDEEASEESSDQGSTEKPKQTPKKVNALRKKSTKSVKSDKHDEEASDESSDEASTEKPKQTTKKLKALGKKSAKSVKLDKNDEETSEESSDEESTEKPQQTPRKVNALRKKSTKSVKSDDKEASGESSDDVSTEMKPIKSEPIDSITFKFVEETPQDSSGSGTQLSKAVKKEKRMSVLKKPDAAESSDETADDKTPDKKVIKTEAKAAVPGTSSQPALKAATAKTSYRSCLFTTERKKSKCNDDDISDGEISSDSAIKHDMSQYTHCHAMRVLRSIDPDFHKFIVAHDSELLNFDSHEKVLDENEGDEEPEQIHVPADKLHVDSDESDFEGDDAEPIQGKVTQQMISDLNNELVKTDGKMKLSTITLVTKLFNGAVKRATSEDGNTEGEFKVTGSGIFNNVVNMCVLYLPNGIKRYLGTDHSEKDPSKCKHFVKIKATLVQYLNDLLKLLEVVTSENILVVMLKHLHQMAPYVACFVRIAKKAIKTILPLWSSGQETVRVLAFVCILRITRSQRSDFLGKVLKAMYMTYIKNCKFVSPTTWPGINFMRRSLVEMYLLNLDVSYPIAFIYLRQLGIILRNALMVPKREHIQAIYNWQYLNSVHLWAQLIPQTMQLSHDITSLIFPLIMIVSNIIKMKPTIKYYPVRFRMIEILIYMTKESERFIPVHGYLMEVLRKFDFNKKPQKVSMKPMDISCMIRLTKSQISENSFKDAVAERVYALLLEYETHVSSELSFPDASMIIIIHLETVARKSTCPNFKKKYQQLHDKIEESSNFIHNIRYTNKMSLRDYNIVRAEQKRIKAAGTPLMEFYEKWKKVNMIQKRKAVTKNDQLAGEMPTVKRTKISEEAQNLFKDNTKYPVTLFPSDSEDETDGFKTLGENEEPPIDQDEAKQKMKKKRHNKEKVGKNEIEIPDAKDDADVEDIVQEFSAGDW